MATKKSRGFTLIELSVVMAISMMLLAATMWTRVNGIREEQAKIQGDAILVLSNAVATYMTNNYNNLVNNTAIGGYANIYAPTVAELITSGLLSNNFNPTNIYGSGYQVSVSRTPGGCVPPNCDVVSLTNLTSAIVDYRTGLIDGPSLGAAANRIGANGGWSTRATPATIAGVDGSWSAANPVAVAGVPVAGILGVRAGYGSSGWAQFLRRDGSLPMTGALNMGTQNINNASGVNAATLATTGAATIGGTLGVTGLTSTNGISNTGAVNTTTIATTGGATIGGTLAVAGATTTNGITNTGTVSTGTLATTGAATVGGTLTVAGATTTNGITNNGDVSTGRLVLTTTVADGAACVGLNGYQARTTAGSIASCINSVWTTPNASTAVIPCSTQTVGAWNASSGTAGTCMGSAAGSPSGTTVTVNASSGGTGSASYFCSGGLWVWQSGSCTPTPCPTQTVSWGGGCSGTISGTVAGGSNSVTASTGVGSATATCSSTGNGAWSTPSGSCVVYSNCSGTATWCGSQLSTYYSMSHGSSTTVSTSASNTYGGQDLGGSISGSATLSCNNGSASYSSRTCSYSTSSPPKYYNTLSPSSLTYPTSDKKDQYCSAVLASGAWVTYSSELPLSGGTSPNWGAWMCWGPSGKTCFVDGGQASWPFCTHPNGCSGWAWTQRTGGAGYIINALSCSYSGA